MTSQHRFKRRWNCGTSKRPSRHECSPERASRLASRNSTQTSPGCRASRTSRAWNMSARTVLAALLAVLCAPAAASARQVTPAPTFGGEVMSEAWFHEFSLPLSEHPYLGSGDPCLTVEIEPGPGLVPLGGYDEPTVCIVTTGTAVFIGGASTSCSDVEPPPFYGEDEAAQRACALANNELVQAILVTVDGGKAIDIRRPRFYVFAPQRELQLPEGNILGVTPQLATFTSNGWISVIRLPPGQHSIQVELTVDVGSPVGVITILRHVVINVIPRGQPE